MTVPHLWHKLLQKRLNHRLHEHTQRIACVAWLRLTMLVLLVCDTPPRVPPGDEILCGPNTSFAEGTEGRTPIFRALPIDLLELLRVAVLEGRRLCVESIQRYGRRHQVHSPATEHSFGLLVMLKPGRPSESGQLVGAVARHQVQCSDHREGVLAWIACSQAQTPVDQQVQLGRRRDRSTSKAVPGFDRQELKDGLEVLLLHPLCACCSDRGRRAADRCHQATLELGGEGARKHHLVESGCLVGINRWRGGEESLEVARLFFFATWSKQG